LQKLLKTAFMDIVLYSEEFRAGLVSIWMEEMGMAQTPALRSGFKKYRKLFNAKDRRNKVKIQKGSIATLEGLQLAIMAALAGSKAAKPTHILKGGLVAEENRVYQDFVNYGVDEIFWRLVNRGTGHQAEKPELGKLAIHVKCPPRFKEGEARLSAGNINPHGGCQVFEEQPGIPGACG